MKTKGTQIGGATEGPRRRRLNAGRCRGDWCSVDGDSWNRARDSSEAGVARVAQDDGAGRVRPRREGGDAASGLGRGRGRPWGRVARERLGSKVKRSEWSNFGGERLLGAANGNDPKKRIQGIKKQSREGEDCAARGKEGGLRVACAGDFLHAGDKSIQRDHFFAELVLLVYGLQGSQLVDASCAMGSGHSLQGQVTKKLHEIVDAHGAPRECTFG